MKDREQVVIVGAGPAGIACAVQLRRYGLDPLLLEKDQPGGLLKNAWRIDNYPGYPEGISGSALVEKLKEHLEIFNIQYSRCNIQRVGFSGDGFWLRGEEEEFGCNYLVIATGTRAKYRGVGYTEVYPLKGVKGKRIAIVGAGDAAFDYAMSLSPSNEVHIHNRGSRIRCIPALLEIAGKQKNISYFENSSPAGNYDYTIFATGREPELGCLTDELMQQKDTLERDGLLYFIGDVKNGMVRQTAVATGDGIRAAMAIVEHSRKK